MLTRRIALHTALLGGLASLLPEILRAQTSSPSATPDTGDGPFKLPALPYAFDALEPSIDAETMRLHHDMHHAAYVRNLNNAVKTQPELGKMELEEILKNLDKVDEKIRKTVRNNAGGDYNHAMFWLMMKPNGGGEPSGALADEINKTFGSFADFKTKFSAEAASVFGSGWAWLVWNGKTLEITSTPNQDNPIMQGEIPLLGLDVWEHAYYLKRQNRRPEYVSAWWNVVNWDEVQKRFAAAKKS